MKNFIAILMTFIFGAMVGNAFGFNPAASGSVATVANIIHNKSEANIAYATGFDLTDINTQLGAYMRKYAKQIQKKIFGDLQFEQYMKSVSGITDEYVSPSASVSEILQPYQAGWTPKGQVDFDARINKVRPIKFDIELAGLEELHRSWLAYLWENDMEPHKSPFVAYIFQEQIFPKMTEELDTMSWSGNYAAPTPGTPGAYLTSTDGIGTIIADEITATNLTPITVGALSPSTMIDKVETYIDGIPEKYKRKIGNIYMSTSNATLYARDYRNTFGGNMDYTPAKGLQVDGTTLKIIGIDAMEGSDRFLATTPGNMVKMYNQIYNPNMFDMTRDGRTHKLFGDFKRGYGFEFLETVFVSDNA